MRSAIRGYTAMAVNCKTNYVKKTLNERILVIYNKIINDEMDMIMLDSFLGVLERIENGELDQHEGSFEIGTILKNIYVDSALKKSKKIDEREKDRQSDPKDMTISEPTHAISYAQFKKQMGNKPIAIDNEGCVITESELERSIKRNKNNKNRRKNKK